MSTFESWFDFTSFSEAASENAKAQEQRSQVFLLRFKCDYYSNPLVAEQSLNPSPGLIAVASEAEMSSRLCSIRQASGFVATSARLLIHQGAALLDSCLLFLELSCL